ncbi:MAG: twin-arginine translocase TatA/TatE family subunit [Anaerolineales bacterium]|nr:twin-arginine translocase TatA/TatE family subunit [Anaerolineales bacterium]
MNIFGVGPLEIVVVLIIGILVLGPEGMVESGRKLGKFMRSVVRSSWWRGLQDGVSEVQNLPYRLMREAELDELRDLEKMGKDILPTREELDPLANTSWRGPQPQRKPEEKPEEKQEEKPEEKTEKKTEKPTAAEDQESPD